jgi:LysR substrate binding domain
VQLETSLRSAEIVERIRRSNWTRGSSTRTDTDDLVITPLYQEQQVLLARAELLSGRSGIISWSDALELPMCLLNKGMRGRQLIDDALDTQDLEVKPRLDTDSVVALLAHVVSRPVEGCAECPALAGVRNLGLDDPSPGRPDLPCNFGDRIRPSLANHAEYGTSARITVCVVEQTSDSQYSLAIIRNGKPIR